MLLFVYRQHMFLFTCMISINNPFLHVLYIEQSILQTIEKPNIHYMGVFFGLLGRSQNWSGFIIPQPPTKLFC